MIVNTTLNQDAEYLGDIQEHRVGIDRANIDFITTLLTANLYSEPLESFLRETVANAQDSHTEAGTEEHILLLIEDVSYATFRFSIRDYGVGISPERFETIYKNIGSSTKRQSNDYIGMFGIGRFSCLSCADTAHITSYYNNIKYSYVMYKNGGGINIDKISEIKGDFKNGLEVSVEKTEHSVYDVIKALKTLYLFDKLFISYTGESYILKQSVSMFNERSLHHYKTFSTCSLLDKTVNYFKVGNVLYPNKETIPLRTTGIIINLPIGTVDITPNREELQYTDYTKKEISSRVQEVKEELREAVNTSIVGNHSLCDFVKLAGIGDYTKVKLMDAEGNTQALDICKTDITLDLTHTTINNDTIPDRYLEFLDLIKYFGIDKSFVHKTVRSTGGSRYFSTEIRHLLTAQYSIMLKADPVTRQSTFLYFTSGLNNTIIMTPKALGEWRERLLSYLNSPSIPKDMVEEGIDFTLKHLPIRIMANDAVPATYLAEYKELQRSKRKKEVDTTEIPIRRYYGGGYKKEYLKSLPPEGMIFYSSHITTLNDTHLKDLGDFLWGLPSIAAFITVKAEHIKSLENNKRFQKVENLLYMKNKIMVKLATAYKIYHKFILLTNKHSTPLYKIPLYNSFNDRYANEVYCIKHSVCNSTIREIFRYYEEKGWLDSCALQYYSLSEEEIEALTGWGDMEHNSSKIIKTLAIKTYGKMPRIGLSLKNLN